MEARIRNPINKDIIKDGRKIKHFCVKYPIKLQLLAIAKVGRSRTGKLNTNFI